MRVTPTIPDRFPIGFFRESGSCGGRSLLASGEQINDLQTPLRSATLFWPRNNESISDRPAWNQGLMRNKRLDILRCVAILLVVAAHAQIWRVTTRVGWVGVDLFFVLSGFLISGLLYSEYKQRQDISFRRFFVRRGLKIYPAFYLLVLATFLGQRLLWHAAPERPIRFLVPSDFCSELFLRGLGAHVVVSRRGAFLYWPGAAVACAGAYILPPGESVLDNSLDLRGRCGSLPWVTSRYNLGCTTSGLF